MGQLTIFEDQAVTSFKNFTIYRSSAGSGKTFTLVKEYLKIVLRNPADFQHVLAITFTNKATEEMKKRILEQLRDMAAGRPTDMQNQIEQEFAHFPQKLDIKSRATKVLDNILHNYSRFAISTIDHFFSQLVRSLARELRLNLNYEIDVDDDTAMQEALQNLYSQLHHTPELKEWVKDFAFNRIEQDKGWQLDYNLIEFGKELFKEKFHKGFSQIDPQKVNMESLRELEQQLQNTRSSYQGFQRDRASEALKIIGDQGLKTYDFKFKGSGTVNTFYKFFKGQFELGKRFVDLACGYDDWYKSGALKADQIKTAVANGLDRITKEIYQYHQTHYQEYVSACHLQRHIYSYGLLDALNEQLKAYRQQNNLMLLSHNGFLLKEIIADREAPFLFEKLGSYYHHVLIDEFQDTSAYQWDNLKPLVTHSLDNQNHVLLVGDVKQSIYRWRGGDLNLLLHQAADELALYRDQLEEKTLQTNWRSAQSVIHFNNTFFRIAHKFLLNTKDLPEDSGMLTEVYREVEQNQHKRNRGAVRLQFFEREEYRKWDQAQQNTLEIVQQHHQSGGRFGDVLILLARNEEVTEISEFLSRHQIPVISDQALRLSNHWAVRLIISAMYLQQNPRDGLARAEMAYLYQKGVVQRETDYHRLFKEALQIKEGPLFKYLPNIMEEKWPSLMHLPVFEWIAEIIRLLIPDERPDPFLERLLELCLEQGKKGVSSVFDFLNWWEQYKDLQMVISPSHQDALRVMTIHKAKGLEAPLVIVPKADFEIKPRKDSIFWTDQLLAQYEQFRLLPLSFSSELTESHFAVGYRRELLEGLVEGLNMAYVAFTRARDRLYIMSQTPSKEPELKDLAVMHKLLWKVCSDPQWEGLWNAQTNSFTLGDLSEKIEPPKQEGLPSADLKSLKIAPYKDKVQIREEAQKFFMLLDHEKTEKIKQGIKLHAVLEKLVSPDTLELVMDRLQSEGVIQTSDRESLVTKVSTLLANPQFKSWFDPSWEVMAEREIVSEGQLFKPDRVVSNKEATLVIDYKKEQRDPKHRKQVLRYATHLEAIGYTNVQSFLVYVDNLELVEVHG